MADPSLNFEVTQAKQEHFLT